MIAEVTVGVLLIAGSVYLFKALSRLQKKDQEMSAVTVTLDPHADVSQFFTWITPTLAVGSFVSSTPPQCWKHFEAILNVSMTEHKEIKLHKNDGLYCNIGFPDREVGPFLTALPQCVAWIRDMQKQNRKTLVHCIAGASRSVSVVAAYLKAEMCPELAVEEIYEKMKALRPEVDPYPGFVTALQNQ